MGAVVNASKSISGLYPNLGPLLLVQAGVPILDDVGLEVFEQGAKGDHVTLAGNRLLLDGVVAKARLLHEDVVRRTMDHARAEFSVRRIKEPALSTPEPCRPRQPYGAAGASPALCICAISSSSAA